jgi:hypothetical protein
VIGSVKIKKQFSHKNEPAKSSAQSCGALGRYDW